MKKLKRIKDNIRIWFQMEIKPGIDRFFGRKSLSAKKWRYINNVPSIKELIDDIKNHHSDARHVDTYTYHRGIARLLEPIELRSGKAVMTKYGIGCIKAIMRSDEFPSQVTKVIVEIMTTNFSRSKGYIKYINLIDLTQLVVYHEPTNQFILVSPKDYVYIVDDNQEITYRVTKRKYATLSPNYKANTEDVKIFNDYKNGALILRRLHAKGYVVTKQ